MGRGLIALFVFAVLMINVIGVSASLEQPSNTNLPLKESYYICYGLEGTERGPRACFLATEESIGQSCPQGFTAIKFDKILNESACEQERSNEMGMLVSSSFKGESYDQYLASMTGRASGMRIASTNTPVVQKGSLLNGLQNRIDNIVAWFKNSFQNIKKIFIK